MTPRPVAMPGHTVLLPPLLFPPSPYFAAIARHGNAVIDTTLAYNKRRKAAHRYEIADTRGRLQLTVPIAKPRLSDHPTWDDVAISRHDNWWEKHLTALESAYGRTPFFEFYIDRLKPLVAVTTPDEFPTVGALNAEAIRRVCAILDLPAPRFGSPDGVGDTAIDLCDSDFTEPLGIDYYQVRADRLGFIDSLSILDLIFNLGPEAQLLLHS